MSFTRRELLGVGAALSTATLLPSSARSQNRFDPRPEQWRAFEVKTRILLEKTAGPIKAWVPLPNLPETAWFRSIDDDWTSNGTAASSVDPHFGAKLLTIEWTAGNERPTAEVTTRFATRDRVVDLSQPQGVADLTPEQVRLYTAPTALIPTGGIVKSTAHEITRGARTDLDKARLIYDWIVDNTFRDPKTRGCGIGDIASMLHMGNLGGKCADLNALYVGLARASGLPARDVYGIRVSPSRFGYKSLGAHSATITKAQHCRADVFLRGFGWVPVDPADVRKVILEEPPGNLPANEPKVVDARRTLFGAWEMNWMPYNTAHDVSLPGSDGPLVGFLMYPQAETRGGRLDSLDPDGFRYEIMAREITI